MRRALARFRVGIAQGCPMSVLLFCLVLELRIAVVLWNVQTPYSTCGRFKHVAYMDDTTYVLQDLDEVPKVLANLQQTRLLTHLHSATTKLLVVVTSKKGLQVQFHAPVLVVGGASAAVASAQTYIRLLGRHALPHVYRPEDFRKLMRASRRANMVLRYQHTTPY